MQYIPNLVVSYKYNTDFTDTTDYNYSKRFDSDMEVFEAFTNAHVHQIPSINLYIEAHPGKFPPPKEDYLLGKNMFISIVILIHTYM